MLDLLFALTYIVPLPLWFLLIVLPNRQFVRRLFGTSYVHVGFAILGSLYLFTLVGAVAVGASDGSFSLDSLFSLAGLQKLLTTPAMVLTFWIHIVTVDLAAMFYVYRSAQDVNLKGFMLNLTLLITLLMAPLGLLIFAFGRILYGMQQRMEAAKLQ
jgi:hypothetical protein